MKTITAFPVAAYELQNLISDVLKSHGINGLVYSGLSSSIVFNSDSPEEVKEIVTNVLLLKEGEIQISVHRRPSASRFKTLIGAPDGSEDFLEQIIVQSDRIGIEFPTNLLIPFLERELSIKLKEIVSENYYECRDGDVSDLFFIVDEEFNSSSSIPQDKLHSAVPKEWVVLENEDLNTAFEVKEHSVEFDMFFETGPIESRMESIIIGLNETDKTALLPETLSGLFNQDVEFGKNLRNADFPEQEQSEEETPKMDTPLYKELYALDFHSAKDSLFTRYGLTGNYYSFVDGKCFVLKE